MSERLLVTGGAGFIGSHVCEELVHRGHQVWILDDFNDQYPPSLKRRNISGLIDRESVHLVEGDVRDTVLVAGLLLDVPFDAVVHLAGRAPFQTAADEPDACYEANTRSTLRLLEAMGRNAVKRLVLASSTAVYGDGKPPFTEEDAADRPTEAVGASKRAAELMAHVYHAAHDFSVHCLRVSTAYGPRQPPDQVMHRLARLLESDGPTHTNGDGIPRRDYVYVDDVADAVRMSTERLLEEEAPVFETFNIAGRECLSLQQLVPRLAEALELDRRSTSPGDANSDGRTICVSPEKAREVLGFEPHHSLDEGLGKFARWLRADSTGPDDGDPSVIGVHSPCSSDEARSARRPSRGNRDE